MATSTSGKPNIIFVMADNVGWLNIGAYHRGMMAGRTPNLDRLASEGIMFTDYYAEGSCTAGRANFITGQLPILTGLTPFNSLSKGTVKDELGTHNGRMLSPMSERIVLRDVHGVGKDSIPVD